MGARRTRERQGQAGRMDLFSLEAINQAIGNAVRAPSAAAIEMETASILPRVSAATTKLPATMLPTTM